MRPNPFDGLDAFLAVAERQSFTVAATELGVSASAVSQTIRALEQRLGLALLERTTRRVGLTEAGAALLARLRPAAAEIIEAIGGLGAYREQPVGLLRLAVPRIALPLVIAPLLPGFRRAYPAIAVEIAVEEETADLAESGFDAGIRVGEAVERDMVAVRMTPDIAWSVVGAPAYFAARGRPQAPAELTQHECIRYRDSGSKAIRRWEFIRDGRAFSVALPGTLTVNHVELALMLARQGMGLVYAAEQVVADDLAARTLEPVLTSQLPATPGLFLYYPARSEGQPKLRAFIDLALRSAKARRGTS